eukprot:tig00000157_g9633.t1
MEQLVELFTQLATQYNSNSNFAASYPATASAFASLPAGDGPSITSPTDWVNANLQQLVAIAETDAAVSAELKLFVDSSAPSGESQEPSGSQNASDPSSAQEQDAEQQHGKKQQQEQGAAAEGGAQQQERAQQQQQGAAAADGSQQQELGAAPAAEQGAAAANGAQQGEPSGEGQLEAGGTEGGGGGGGEGEDGGGEAGLGVLEGYEDMDAANRATLQTLQKLMGDPKFQDVFYIASRLFDYQPSGASDADILEGVASGVERLAPIDAQILGGELSRYEAEHPVAAAGEDAAALAAENDALEARVAELQAKLAALEGGLKGAEEAEGRAAALEAEKAALEARLAEAEGAQAELAQLRAENEALEKERAALETEAAKGVDGPKALLKCQASLEGLERAAEEAEAAAEEAEARALEAEEELARARARVRELVKENTELQNGLEDADADLRDAFAERDRAVQGAKQARTQVQSLRREVAQLKEEVDARNDEEDSAAVAAASQRASEYHSLLVKERAAAKRAADWAEEERAALERRLEQLEEALERESTVAAAGESGCDGCQPSCVLPGAEFEFDASGRGGAKASKARPASEAPVSPDDVDFSSEDFYRGLFSVLVDDTFGDLDEEAYPALAEFISILPGNMRLANSWEDLRHVSQHKNAFGRFKETLSDKFMEKFLRDYTEYRQAKAAEDEAEIARLEAEVAAAGGIALAETCEALEGLMEGAEGGDCLAADGALLHEGSSNDNML